MRELPPPPDALSDPNALEMVRGWIINGNLQASVAAWVWQENPVIWGRLLADIAGHLADAIATEKGLERDDVFQQIADSVRHHLAIPPDDLSGEFIAPLQ